MCARRGAPPIPPGPQPPAAPRLPPPESGYTSCFELDKTARRVRARGEARLKACQRCSQLLRAASASCKLRVKALVSFDFEECHQSYSLGGEVRPRLPPGPPPAAAPRLLPPAKSGLLVWDHLVPLCRAQLRLQPTQFCCPCALSACCAWDCTRQCFLPHRLAEQPGDSPHEHISPTGTGTRMRLDMLYASSTFSEPAASHCCTARATVLLLKSSQPSMAPACCRAAAENGGRGYKLLPPSAAMYLRSSFALSAGSNVWIDVRNPVCNSRTPAAKISPAFPCMQEHQPQLPACDAGAAMRWSVAKAGLPQTSAVATHCT